MADFLRLVVAPASRAFTPPAAPCRPPPLFRPTSPSYTNSCYTFGLLPPTVTPLLSPSLGIVTATSVSGCTMLPLAPPLVSADAPADDAVSRRAGAGADAIGDTLTEDETAPDFGDGNNGAWNKNDGNKSALT